MIIPVLVRNIELQGRIKGEFAKMGDFFHPVFFSENKGFLEYLKYELPQFNIIHFSEGLRNITQVIKAVKNDSWLHAGGIIGIHEESENDLLVKTRSLNIISLIHLRDFQFSFPRVLKITKENYKILFHRDLQQKLLPRITGSLIMSNDPFDVKTYSNLVTNYLFNSNYLNRDQKERLHVALFEMLMNAVEHGNCEITFEEKKTWLEGGGDIIDLIKEKNKDPRISRKKVCFSYLITKEKSSFTIKDEGTGFDYKIRLANAGKPGVLALHGHGIKMTAIYTENLSYNKKGNKVSFSIPHSNLESNLIPKVLQDKEEVTFRKNQIIFRENEESNYLYYIVSGELCIYSKGKMISRLTPDDIFLGEMSFLINNRRSATVKAGRKSTLIKISKDQFLTLIKENPHYGILLSRLLAQRLIRLHEYTYDIQVGNTKK